MTLAVTTSARTPFSPAKCAAYLECAVALAFAKTGLKLFRLPRLSHAGCTGFRWFRFTSSPPSISEARHLAGRIARLGRTRLQAVCLPQALALQWLVARRAGECTLHIGVAKDDAQQLRSHAWGTYQGEVVIGAIADLNNYREILLIPAVDRRAQPHS